MNVFKIIPIDLYGHDIVVSIGQIDDDLYDLIKENISRKRFDKLLGNQTAIATTSKFKNGCIIIRFSKDIKDIGIVAHEAFHAIIFLFEKIGIQFSYQSEEAYAYALEFLVNQILKIKEEYENNNSCESKNNSKE